MGKDTNKMEAAKKIQTFIQTLKIMKRKILMSEWTHCRKNFDIL